MRKTAIPLGLVFLNLLLKVRFLDSMPVSGDEAFSLFHAQMDIPSIIAQLSQGNNPPLFEILLHFWIRWFGISPFAARFLPMVFSSLTVLFIYLTGIRFFNRRVALMAALIYTFSNYSILFSHEARAYPLFGLLTSISMFAFFNIVKGHKLRSYMPVLVASNIILVYTHFLGFFLPAIQLFCCLAFPVLRREKLRHMIVACALLAIAYLPYIGIFLARVHTSVIHGTWLRPVAIDQAYNIIRGFSNQPVVAVIFLCAVVIGSLKLLIRRGEYISIYAKITAVWFVLPFLLMLFISLKYFPFNIPVFQDRYLIFTSVAFFLMVAVTFDYIFDAEGYRIVISAVPIALMLFTCTPDPDNKMHIADAVKKVRQLKTQKTIVYVSPAFYSANFAYYYDRRYFSLYATDAAIYRRVDSCLSQDRIYPISTDREIDTAVSNAADSIIFFDVLSDFLLPGNHIYSYLSSHYTLTARYDYPSVYSVYIFRKRVF